MNYSRPKRWCFDIDNTICSVKPPSEPYTEYANVTPYQDIIDFINERYNAGDYIILSTARCMATTQSNLGLINARVGKITLDWLEKHGVKFHEIYWGKPYADEYVDDKALHVDDLRIHLEWRKLNEK